MLHEMQVIVRVDRGEGPSDHEDVAVPDEERLYGSGFLGRFVIHDEEGLEGQLRLRYWRGSRLGFCRRVCSGKAFPGELNVAFINFKSNTGGNIVLSGRNCGGSDSQEGIQKDGVLSLSMEKDALLDESGREGGRVRALIFPGTDCLVGDEPGVPPAAEIRPSGVLPSLDIGFVSVGNTACPAIKLNGARFRQVKDELVAVIDIALGIDWFEVSRADRLMFTRLYGDGLDPVEGVLELEQLVGGKGEEQLVRQEGVAG